MKNKKHLAVGKRGISLTALALVACMLLTLAGTDIGRAKAEPVNLKADCFLTVNPGDKANQEELKELENGDVVIDLYKVADAKEVPGYDTYAFAIEDGSPYKPLEDMLKGENIDYSAAAQEAAKITFPENTEGKFTRISLKEGEVISQESGKVGEKLESGLYLLIARSPRLEAAEDYVVKNTVKVKQEDNTEKEITELATIAYSEHHTYTFLPELIALPSKEAVTTENGPEINTANPGDWITNLTVTLKPAEGPRYGELQIQKTLESYGGAPVSFVFQVEAFDADPRTNAGAQIVFSKIVTADFSSAGTRSLTICEDPQEGHQDEIQGKIPVGSYVRVMEIYTGPSYQMTAGQEDLVIIPAPDSTETATAAATVAFTNAYRGTTTSGGTITNHFEKVTVDGRDQWNWSKNPDVSGLE